VKNLIDLTVQGSREALSISIIINPLNAHPKEVSAISTFRRSDKITERIATNLEFDQRRVLSTQITTMISSLQCGIFLIINKKCHKALLQRKIIYNLHSVQIKSFKKIVNL
jgi:hypothetical protein